MEFSFISNRPWVDETIRLRKALFFTTLFTIILGLVIGIIGVVLVAYMEFVVGVIAIIFGVLLPVGYVGANILLLAKRRKDYDKDFIIEYKFTEEHLEIIKLSKAFKSKDVIDYSNLKVNKVYNRSRFIVIKTTSYFADYIVLRKSDIKIDEGADKNQMIVSFVSFLMAKVAEAEAVNEVTCTDELEGNSEQEVEPKVSENTVNNEISGLNDEKEAIPTPCEEDTNSEDNEEDNDASKVEFCDLTSSDENVDIQDEAGEIEPTPTHTEHDVEEEPIEDGEDYKALFDYSEEMNVSDEPRSEPKVSYLQDYSTDEEDKD